MESNLLKIVETLLFGYPVQGESVDPNYPLFLQQQGGLLLTFLITFSSLLFGIVIGTLLATGTEVSRFINKGNWFVKILLQIIHVSTQLVSNFLRAIPLVVIILFAFYLPFPLLGVRVPPVFLAIIALSIYAGIYLSPIFQSGLKSVSIELLLSAKVLGLSKIQILFTIFIPIAMRSLLPSMLNIAVTLFKDSSVLIVVGIAELTFTSRQMMVGSPTEYSLILFLVMFLYCGFSFIASKIIQNVEAHWGVLGLHKGRECL